jgi:hypothetical protein
MSSLIASTAVHISESVLYFCFVLHVLASCFFHHFLIVTSQAASGQGPQYYMICGYHRHVQKFVCLRLILSLWFLQVLSCWTYHFCCRVLSHEDVTVTVTVTGYVLHLALSVLIRDILVTEQGIGCSLKQGDSRDCRLATHCVKICL